MNEKREISKLVPTSVIAARVALKDALPAVRKARTYDELRKIERWAGAMRVFWKHIEDIRHEAERVIILAAWRSGQMANIEGRKAGGRSSRSQGEMNYRPTLVEMFNSTSRGTRLRRLGKLGEDREPVISEKQLMEMIDSMHAEDREATVSAILKHIAALNSEDKRKRSRAAKSLPDAMDMRIGDCRVVLADISDNSVPLILTDPPYGDEAEPLYQWLAQWSARVLIPGGSLICFTGQSRLNRDIRVFDEHLRYWWLLTMIYAQPQRFPGKFVMAGFKPVLWYVKEFRRGRTLIADVLRDRGRDKSEHDWGQGESGVTQLIEDLTEPSEVIVDPFAGSGLWGHIAASKGRRWIGADIVEGGDTAVAAE